MINSPAPLLPWPSEPRELPQDPFGGGWLIGAACAAQQDALAYERARANAAMQRLRVAVEALDTIRQSQNELAMTRHAKDALATIGPLPASRESRESRESLEGKSE